MSPSASSASQADVAVVDVGSNSVRLVMYRLDGRAIWTVFNEKVLAGLGRDLAATGRLAPDGIAQAMQALVRFQAIIAANRPARKPPWSAKSTFSRVGFRSSETRS